MRLCKHNVAQHLAQCECSMHIERTDGHLSDGRGGCREG